MFSSRSLRALVQSDDRDCHVTSAYRLSDMELEGFCAWIAAKGEELPAYKTELSTDRKSGTCWIVSEAGAVRTTSELFCMFAFRPLTPKTAGVLSQLEGHFAV
jgi:hypothetical protein